MRQLIVPLVAALGAAGLLVGASSVRKPFGIEKRTLWTTLKVRGTPDPPPPYRTEIAFPKLTFSEPLEMAVAPGTNRLAVAERRGKIYSFVNHPQTSEKQLLADAGKTVYGLAFHPKFAENGSFYVTSVLDPENPSPKGSRLLRYRTGSSEPEVIFEWPSGGHNGGCIRFGPDGYLYLVTGDGSGIADELQTGQDVSDVLASVLRIDVDRPGPGGLYSIPADNPFAGMAGARGEIWAYGLRQLWKFSFDPQGRLWGGEVGQDLWEMVYLIQKGGNYGWSVTEGLHPFRPERPKGPTPVLKPLVEHSHSDFRSITGGYVYTGSRLAELGGAYIYGDYDTGRIWALRYDGSRVSDHRELADTQLRIVAWGQDSAGEVYAVDFIGGAIHRLVPAPRSRRASEFPRKLSQTGLFASTKKHLPAPGLIPYSVNAALWSDGAHKERYIALPGDSKIEFERVVYPQPAPGSQPGWQFPDGTVLVKTFSMEMEAGNAASARRLETRLLVHELVPGNDEVGSHVWYGYTYVWNDRQTDAYLLDAAGLDRKLVIGDRNAPGGQRDLTWRFPSRAECTLCHTMSAKFALGVNTRQMNKDHDYGGVVANQLRTLEHLGVFTKPLPAPPEQLARLPDYEDAAAPLDARARSYLDSNCSHCHRKWGGGNAEFQLLASLPLEETGLVGVRPAHGDFGVEQPRLLVPGHPERSMILDRMQRIGLGRMPHVASNVVHQEAVRLVREWIAQLR